MTQPSLTLRRSCGMLRGTETALASLAINLLALAMPLMMLQIYDRIIPNHALNTLAMLAIGVGVALLTEAALKMLRTALLSRAATRFEAETSLRAAHHLLTCDLAAYEATSVGHHAERLNAVPQLRDYGSGQVFLTLYDMPFLLVYSGLIWVLGGPLVLVCAAGFLALVAVTAYFGRHNRDALEAAADTNDERYSFLTQALGGLVSVKAMALEATLQRRYEALQRRRLGHLGDAQHSAARLTELSQFIQQATTVGTVAFGSLLVLKGDVGVGALSACTLLVGRFLSLTQNLVLTATRLQSTGVAREQVEKLFALPAGHAPTGTLDPRAGKGEIALENVSFSYREDGRPLLDGVSFEIRRGDIMALVGTNGSGKSSLLAMLAGLYTPQSGRILLDGTPLDEFDAEAWRATIALVPQQETLFAGTVLDNLTLFQPSRIPAAMAAAARTGLDEPIAALPLGFATPVGDAAAESLPRGLVQRIALTRALMTQPRLLLLDDATSAIDDHGDAKFEALLTELRRDCAVILVSHRPSVIKLATRVLRLDGGKIDALEGVF